MSDIRQTKEWAQYLTQIGWKAEKIGNNYVYIKKLPLLESYIKIPRPSWPIDLEKVNQTAQQNRALCVKIDPKVRIDDPNAISIDSALKEAGYKKDYWTLTIAKTLMKDLSQSQQNLLKSFEKDTRYSINLAKREGVAVTRSSDFDLFYKLYQNTSRMKEFKIPSYQELKIRYQVFSHSKKCLLLFSYMSENPEPIAACLILFNTAAREAIYHIAARSNNPKSLMSPYLLVWEAMLLAKKKGCKTFDFDGIYDKRYFATRNWKGFSSFKQGFGGQEVSYLGSYIKSYSPLVNRFSLYLATHLFPQ